VPSPRMRFAREIAHGPPRIRATTLTAPAGDDDSGGRRGVSLQRVLPSVATLISMLLRRQRGTSAERHDLFGALDLAPPASLAAPASSAASLGKGFSPLWLRCFPRFAASAASSLAGFRGAPRDLCRLFSGRTSSSRLQSDSTRRRCPLLQLLRSTMDSATGSSTTVFLSYKFRCSGVPLATIVLGGRRRPSPAGFRYGFLCYRFPRLRPSQCYKFVSLSNRPAPPQPTSLLARRYRFGLLRRGFSLCPLDGLGLRPPQGCHRSRTRRVSASPFVGKPSTSAAAT